MFNFIEKLLGRKKETESITLDSNTSESLILDSYIPTLQPVSVSYPNWSIVFGECVKCDELELSLDTSPSIGRIRSRILQHQKGSKCTRNRND